MLPGGYMLSPARLALKFMLLVASTSNTTVPDNQIPFPDSNATSGNLNYTYEASPAAFTNAGQGVDIYILDSGVYYNHTDFANRVEQSPVFARYTTTGDVFGHGIAAGTRFGVAKQARIIDVKVITDTGRGFASDMYVFEPLAVGIISLGHLDNEPNWRFRIAGLSWAVAHANSTGRPSVFNLSLGGGTSNALDDAVLGVVDAGIHTVVAAGNANIDASEWSPARVPGVIAVGNVDINGVRSETSNYGSPVTVFAPGMNITSAGINGPTSSRVDSGTSMAAPHVAGLVAYLIGLEGPRTPPEMKTRVQALARADILSAIRKSYPLISFEQLLIPPRPTSANGTVNLMSQNML
ncbi:subtilisin-like serine protease [Ceratobasidium sp. 423]|nr:subtilisin-like serine protease [Ceratobasidium sp. 423]